jgi:hypothetical protein
VPKALHAVSAGTVDAVEGVPIGESVASTARFTTLSATGDVSLGTSSSDSVVVAGALRVASGTPGAGKLLVSDADGNASWQAISAPGLPNRVLQVGEGAQYATIQDALAAITDNDEDHPYVVKVGPGVYDEVVAMKPYVDLVGSGRNVTKVGNEDVSSSTPVLTAAPNSVVRDISFAQKRWTSATGAISVSEASGCVLERLSLTVIAGSYSATGILVEDAQLTCRDVSAKVVGSSTNYALRTTGWSDDGTSVSLSGCSLDGSTSVYAGSGALSTLKLVDCDLAGKLNNRAGNSIALRDSVLSGNVDNVTDSDIVFVGCDVSGCAIENGEGDDLFDDQDPSSVEFRGGSFEGTIDVHSWSNARFSFAKLVLTEEPTSHYGAASIKFYHCHDEDLNEVASPAR